MRLFAIALALAGLLIAANATRLTAAARVSELSQTYQDDDGQKDDGQKNKKDDGQQNQKDDGQKNQKDDGQQGQNDDGQKNQKDDGQQNQGVVKQVDTAKNTITLVVRGEGKEVDKTFALTQGVPVRIADKASDLGDLKAGMRVVLTLSKDGKVVVGIKDAGQEKRQSRTK